MKLLGRILAILLAGVVSVLLVQQVVQRAYRLFGKRKYITLIAEEQDLP